MLTFEAMATFVCHYGGTPKTELERLYRKNLDDYHLTGDVKYKNLSDRFLGLIRMHDDGIHFVEHETTSTFYYEPKEGWNVLYDYIEEGRIVH